VARINAEKRSPMKEPLSEKRLRKRVINLFAQKPVDHQLRITQKDGRLTNEEKVVS
jgi:hypothetical protein